MYAFFINKYKIQYFFILFVYDSYLFVYDISIF